MTQVGFAAMDPKEQKKIASRGGKAAQRTGRAHQFTPEQARAAGRSGGLKVSQDRAHMAAIGRKGGHACAAIPGHMSKIGAKGGAASAGTPKTPKIEVER